MEKHAFIVGLYPSFSRHAKDKVNFSLVIWLNENVGSYPSFSRHAKGKVNFSLVIWLNENVKLCAAKVKL